HPCQETLMRNLVVRLVSSICIVLSGSLCAWGQFSGNIQGEVRDASGASIANATLTLTNVSTNVQKTAISSANGSYRFVSLAPSEYKISVTARGFNPSTVSVTLLTDQTIDVPLQLEVASASESVTVTAEAPVLDTADSRTHLTIETQDLTNLPLQGRS